MADSKPAASRPSDFLKAFMQHLNRALETKTGEKQGRAARRIYGVCIPYLRRHPDELKALSTEIDKLPRHWTARWYVSAVRAIIHRREQMEPRVHPWLQDRMTKLTAGIG